MASATDSRVVEGFLDYLKIEKGLAPLSIVAYRPTLDNSPFFWKDTSERCSTPSAITCVNLSSNYLAMLSMAGPSEGNFRRLRNLYRYLLLDKIIEHDPTLNIDSPKQWKVLPKALARAEMESYASSAMRRRAVKRREAIAARDHAMLEVFYAAALRVSEIIGVQLQDLKLDLGCILVRGKGDKERIVPLGKGAQDALTPYMKDSRPILAKGKSSPLLFLGRGGRKLTRQRVWQMVRAANGPREESQPTHAAAQLRHAHG